MAQLQTTGTTGSFQVLTGGAVKLNVTSSGVNIGDTISDSTFITGSLITTGSLQVTGSTSFSYLSAGSQITTFQQSSTGYTILARVSSSLNYLNDTAAATGGVPLGGLYRSGSLIRIRLT